MFEPLHADVLASVVFRQIIQVRHEDLQAGFGSHAGVAVDQLVLIVVEIEIKPRVIREIHHDEIHVMHGEFSEVYGPVVQSQKVSPLFDAGQSVFAISENFFDIRSNYAHFGQLSTNMGRGKQFDRIEKDVVAGDFNARNALGMDKVRDRDVQSTEKSL